MTDEMAGGAEDNPRVVRASASSGVSGGDGGSTSQPTPILSRLGGEQYHWRTVRNCPVCHCSKRVEIERLLLHGVAYATIAKRLGEAEVNGEPVKISTQSIKRHVYQDHMPVKASIRRAAVDARTRDLGHDMELFEGQMVDHHLFLQEAQRMAYEQLVSGSMPMTMDNALKVTGMLIKVDEMGQETVNTENFVVAFQAMLDCTFAVQRAVEAGHCDTSIDAQKALLGQLMARKPELEFLSPRRRRTAERDTPHIEASSSEDA